MRCIYIYIFNIYIYIYHKEEEKKGGQQSNDVEAVQTFQCLFFMLKQQMSHRGGYTITVTATIHTLRFTHLPCATHRETLGILSVKNPFVRTKQTNIRKKTQGCESHWVSKPASSVRLRREGKCKKINK